MSNPWLLALEFVTVTSRVAVNSNPGSAPPPLSLAVESLTAMLPLALTKTPFSPSLLAGLSPPAPDQSLIGRWLYLA